MPRSITSTAPGRRNQVLIGGVVLLAVISTLLSVLVLGRGPATAADDPSQTPVPSAPASPSPEPTVPESPDEAPSETPLPSQPQPQHPVVTPAPAPAEPAGPKPVVQAPEGVIPPGSVVRVVIDGLRLREAPSTDAEQYQILSRGDLLLVGYYPMLDGFGTVDADGHTWIPVRDLNASELPDLGDQLPQAGRPGWVAIGSGDTDFVELVAPRCVEGDPDLQTLSSMTPWEQLACFGNRSITLEGVFGCGGCGGYLAGSFEPVWIASPMNYNYLSVDPSTWVGPMSLHFSPDGPQVPSMEDGAPILRVTGHFDDAAAADCVIRPGEPVGAAIDADLAELYCGTKFVVDSYEVLGIDEDFPMS